jgi:putative copper resistance protein D
VEAQAPDLLLATVRSVHFFACLVLFGELAFGPMVDRSARPRSGVLEWSIGVAALTALAWLALEAANMSGEPVPVALRAELLGRVLLHTQFGAAWLVRMALLALVVATARRAVVLPLLAAAGVLCALAWMGHAGAAASGVQRAGELAADAAHVLAAGAWIGTLPALVAALRRHADVRERATITQRYSRLATAAVIVILFTGIVNTRVRVGTIDALLHSNYGELLLAKIALVALMLVVAAANRWLLTPRLAAGDVRAAIALRRNASAEILLGALVIALVGVLGITAPAMMVMPGTVH